MSRRAILLAILLTLSPVYVWSGVQEATTPATDTPAPQNATVDSASGVPQGKKGATESSHKPHIHLGAITVGAGYSHFPGGRFGYPYRLYPFGFGYSPFFADSFLGPYSMLYYPGYANGFQAGYGKGEIKLTTSQKKAKVFLDGAYAGAAEDLKNIWLDPGAYDLSVKSENCATFRQHIYVLSGKKLKITATLIPLSAAEVKP